MSTKQLILTFRFSEDKLLNQGVDPVTAFSDIDEGFVGAKKKDESMWEYSFEVGSEDEALLLISELYYYSYFRNIFDGHYKLHSLEFLDPMDCFDSHIGIFQNSEDADYQVDNSMDDFFDDIPNIPIIEENIVSKPKYVIMVILFKKLLNEAGYTPQSLADDLAASMFGDNFIGYECVEWYDGDKDSDVWEYSFARYGGKLEVENFVAKLFKIYPFFYDAGNRNNIFIKSTFEDIYEKSPTDCSCYEDVDTIAIDVSVNPFTLILDEEKQNANNFISAITHILEIENYSVFKTSRGIQVVCEGLKFADNAVEKINGLRKLYNLDVDGDEVCISANEFDLEKLLKITTEPMQDIAPKLLHCIDTPITAGEVDFDALFKSLGVANDDIYFEDDEILMREMYADEGF